MPRDAETVVEALRAFVVLRGPLVERLRSQPEEVPRVERLRRLAGRPMLLCDADLGIESSDDRMIESFKRSLSLSARSACSCSAC